MVGIINIVPCNLAPFSWLMVSSFFTTLNHLIVGELQLPERIDALAACCVVPALTADAVSANDILL